MGLRTSVVPEGSFWVTNISPMNVTLSDLNITIRAQSSINLLDKKHYSFTKEQLLKSVKDGSLYKKNNRIVIRKVLPYTEEKEKITISTNGIPTRQRSILVINEKKCEELEEIKDKRAAEEAFAEETADLTDEPGANNGK
jgi:hypothetical protein